MEPIAILTILGVFIANSSMIIPLFLWNRYESRAYYRYVQGQVDSTSELVRAIHDEVKDFHDRLCKIEERNRK